MSISKGLSSAESNRNLARKRSRRGALIYRHESSSNQQDTFPQISSVILRTCSQHLANLKIIQMFRRSADMLWPLDSSKCCKICRLFTEFRRYPWITDTRLVLLEHFQESCRNSANPGWYFLTLGIWKCCRKFIRSSSIHHSGGCTWNYCHPEIFTARTGRASAATAAGGGAL